MFNKKKLKKLNRKPNLNTFYVNVQLAIAVYYLYSILNLNTFYVNVQRVREKLDVSFFFNLNTFYVNVQHYNLFQYSFSKSFKYILC